MPATAIFEVWARDAANWAAFSDLAAPITLAFRYAERSAFVERGLALYRHPTISDTWTTAGLSSPSHNAPAWIPTRHTPSTGLMRSESPGG